MDIELLSIDALGLLTGVTYARKPSAGHNLAKEALYTL